MKHFKLFYLGLLLILILPQQLFSQAPDSINYQAVARDLSGNPLVTTPVAIQFDVIQGSLPGTIVYTETHAKTTNQFGLFTAEIGGGTPTFGTFPGINWSLGLYHLRVSVNGDVMPSTQLLSVPYALHANTAATGVPGANGHANLADSVAEPAGVNCINGGYLIHMGADDNDDGTLQILERDISYYICNGLDGSANNSDTSATNEIQTLSISNDTIFLSNGGFVVLPSLGDNDWTQGSGVVYNNTDFVGIGTTTPIHPLTVVSADTVVASFTGSHPDASVISVWGLDPNSFVGTVFLSGPTAADSSMLAVDPSQKTLFLSNLTPNGHVAVSGDSTAAMYGQVVANIATDKIINSADTMFNLSSTGTIINVNLGSFFTDSLYVLGNNFNQLNYVLANDGQGQAVWTDASTIPGIGGGAFATALGVTSNSPGAMATDDFVFGSIQMNDLPGFTDDSRFYFDKSSGAFRVGTANSTAWDLASRGANSFAQGSNTVASGANSVSMGFANQAAGDVSVALGKTLLSPSFVEIVVGMLNTPYVPASATTWNVNDRLFTVGNGSAVGSESDAMVILKSGSVGIGTALPGAGLEVAGSAIWQSAIGINNTGGGNDWRLSSQTTGGFAITKANGITFTPFEIWGTGRVLVNDVLSISNGTTYTYTFPSAQGAANTVLMNDGAGNVTWQAPSAGGLWQSNAPDIYYNTGKVGIGMSAPQNALEVHTSVLNSFARFTNSVSDTLANDGVFIGINSGDAFFNNAENGNMLFFTNNSEKVRIDNLGNVGIGTTTPGVKLHVADNAQTILGIESSNANPSDGSHISLLRSRGNTTLPSNVFSGDRLGVVEFLGYNSSTSNYEEVVSIRGFADEAYTGGSTSSHLTFHVNPAGQNTMIEAMRINGNGFIGIGTPNPNANLDVVGVTETDNLRVLAGAGIAGDVLISDAAGNATWQTPPTGGSPWTISGSDIFQQNLGDWVGIGTNSPTEMLAIGSQGTAISVSTQESSHRIALTGSFWNGGAIAHDFTLHNEASTITAEAGRLAIGWSGNGSELMSILSTGNVGIGTTTPTSTLDIIGKIKITDGTEGNGKVLVSNAIGTATWKTKNISFHTGMGASGAQVSITQGTLTTLLFDFSSSPFQLNDGGAFNIALSVFTAPVSGVYQFDANVIMVGGTTGFYVLELMHSSGSPLVREHCWSNGIAQAWYTASLATTVHLNAGESVWVEALNNNTPMSFDQAKSTFSGHLVYED